jgi:hypothetical protein
MDGEEFEEVKLVTLSMEISCLTSFQGESHLVD